MNSKQVHNIMKKPISQNAIARALGISAAAMTKCKKMGMPVETEEAARTWRQNNIKPTMHAYLKANTARLAPAPQPSVALQRATEIMEHADAVLGAGLSIAALVPTLRAALTAVPAAERGVYSFLSWRVMDVLTADVFALLPKGENPMTDDGHPIYTGNMSDEDAVIMGDFWYRVAAGEQMLVNDFIEASK